jgi:hypothetical protein
MIAVMHFAICLQMVDFSTLELTESCLERMDELDKAVEEME